MIHLNMCQNRGRSGAEQLLLAWPGRLWGGAGCAIHLEHLVLEGKDKVGLQPSLSSASQAYLAGVPGQGKAMGTSKGPKAH